MHGLGFLEALFQVFESDLVFLAPIIDLFRERVFQILVFLGARCNKLCDQLPPLNGRQRYGLFSNLGKRHVGQLNRCVPEVKFPLGEPYKTSLQRAIGSIGIF